MESIKTYSILLFAFIFFAGKSLAQNESLSDLDMDNLSQEDCYFIDSVLSVEGESMEIDALIENYNALITAYADYDKYFNVIDCYDRFIPILERNGRKKELAEAWTDKSLSHDMLGQYIEGLEASQNALRYFEEIDDQEGVAYTYNDIGVIHYYLANYDLSREYLTKSFDIFSELNDTNGIALYYNNIANTYFDTDDWEDAIKMYEKGLELDQLTVNYEGQSICLSNLGETYMVMGDYDKAEEYLLESLRLAETYGDKDLLIP